MNIINKKWIIVYLVSLICHSGYANLDEVLQRIEALEKKVRLVERENAKLREELKNYKTTQKQVLVKAAQVDIEKDQLVQNEDIKQRLSKLESEQLGSAEKLPGWLQNLRLSGNADFAYYAGDDNALSPDSRLAVENARLFFDFNINNDSSFFFEWDIVRETAFKNNVGQMYLRLDRLFENESLNLKVGRFPIPFGEEYLRFHEQRWENPLISYSAPAPYNWDEGIELFGSLADYKLDYIFAITDGDNGFNSNSNESLQIVGKISYKPTNQLYTSLSGLSSGTLGAKGVPGISAFEFGGSHLYQFGSTTNVVNFQNGVPVPDDPSEKISVTAWELDVIYRPIDLGHIWLAYGQSTIESKSSSFYDRDLQYWIAEGVLELGALSKQLNKYYLAARYSAIGTFDSNKGYALEAMNNGKELGYNTESVNLFSLGLGARFREYINLKIEYSWYDFNVINGVTQDIKDKAGKKNQLGIGLTTKF